MNLGERIKYIRKIHSLNQKDFADRLAVSQGTLSDLERGTCSPSCETIAALRGAFECDLNWLVQESGDVKEDFPIYRENNIGRKTIARSCKNSPPRRKNRIFGNRTCEIQKRRKIRFGYIDRV